MIFQFNPYFADATNDQKWEQIIAWRNAELFATDWTQLPDSPADKTSWAAYRQELRDLVDTTKNADDVIIPTPPGA